MRNIKPLIAAIVLVALAAGAYWWVTSNKKLMWALTRGSVNRTSTSTQDYEIALRLARKDGIPFEEKVAAKEWILRLPRTYVTREMGKNGSVFHTDERQYFISIDLNVGDDGQSFTPSVGKSNDQLIVRSMQLSLINDDAIQPIRRYNLCVPQDKNEEILRPHGEYGYNRICPRESLRCGISMHVDGWSLDIAVTQDLYANPDQACALARKFLNQYTNKRDELR